MFLNTFAFTSKVKGLKEMKVVGMTFDWKLFWRPQGENLTAKSNKMMTGIKIIRNKFTEH